MFSNFWGYNSHYGMMDWGMWNFMGSGSGLFWLFIGLRALFYVGLIIAAILIFRSWRRNHKSAIPQNSTHLDTLKNLYASGKIDEEEYLRRKEVLERK